MKKSIEIIKNSSLCNSIKDRFEMKGNEVITRLLYTLGSRVMAVHTNKVPNEIYSKVSDLLITTVVISTIDSEDGSSSIEEYLIDGDYDKFDLNDGSDPLLNLIERLITASIHIESTGNRKVPPYILMTIFEYANLYIEYISNKFGDENKTIEDILLYSWRNND